MERSTLPGTDRFELRAPRLDDEAAFRAAHASIAAEFPRFGLYWAGEQDDFASYVRRLEDARRGVGIPSDHVPSTTLFAFEGGACLGRLNVRHELNAWLREVGGHVGYAVVPAHRRRGVATFMLREALVLARGLGIRRVLVTCDASNAASARVIENCGGVFDALAKTPELEEPKRRYWLPTGC